MNTDEPDTAIVKSRTTTIKPKLISTSLTTKKINKEITTTNVAATKSISISETTKRLITTNTARQPQQQFRKNKKILAATAQIATTATVATKSSLSSSTATTTLLPLSTKKLSASLSSLTSSVIERDTHHSCPSSSANVRSTNTNVVNQLNLVATTTKTATKMPTRTTRKIPTTNTTITATNIKSSTTISAAPAKNLALEPSSMLMLPTSTSPASSSVETSSTNIMKASPFRRSYSVPILKLDDVARERIQIGCDNHSSNKVQVQKNGALNGANLIQLQKPHQQPQQSLIDECATSIETSTTIMTATTKTTAPTTTRATPLRPKPKPQQQAIEFQLSKRTAVVTATTTAAINAGNIATSDHDNGICHIREDLRFGCAHYKRRAMFVTPCCNKFYKCRFCHDENESHHFDRKTLNELICSECNKRQKVQEECVNCGVRFGKYTCLICNLFDDEDKKQYHCDACGICRIGGAENFFHCEVCNMCLPIQLKIDGHKCVENISRSHCPVCLGDIHTSRIPCHIPDCGHLLHKMCFDQLLASGHYACPTCQTSLIDMTALWDFLDAQASQMPMPKKYENQRIHIFCNDCQRTSKTNFHFLGLKCMECGAYNTTQDVKRRVSLVPDEPNTA